MSRKALFTPIKSAFTAFLILVLMIGFVPSAAYAELATGDHEAALAQMSTSAGSTTVKQVNRGIWSTAVLLSDGSLWTWGADDKGFLGANSGEKYLLPRKVMSGVEKFSMNNLSGAAIKKDGTLWTWGGNSSGQLGDGTKADRLEPAMVEGLSNVVDIEMGSHPLALTADGKLWRWGDVPTGDSSYTIHTTPRVLLNNIESFAGNGNNGAAIDKQGNLWVFGRHFHHWAGSNEYRTEFWTPRIVMNDVADVQVTTWNTVALQRDGSLWTWGDNRSGQLGDGSYEINLEPTKVLGGVESFSAPSERVFAVMSDGSLYAWGNEGSFSGSLGTGGTGGKINTPTKIIESGVRLCRGSYAEGSLVLKADGSLWTLKRTPTQMALADVAGWDAGQTNITGWCAGSAAVTTDGSLWVWGSNDFGQLGTGTTTSSNTPIKIFENSQWLYGSEDASGWEDNGQHVPSGYDFQKDSFPFSNFKVREIDRGYFTTMYEFGAGALFNKKKNSSAGSAGGVCFGMSYVTASVYCGFPSISSFKYANWYDINGEAYDATCIRDLNRDVRVFGNDVRALAGCFINDLFVPLDSYLQYAHIYQWSAEHCQNKFGSESVNGPQYISSLRMAVRSNVNDGKIGVVLHLLPDSSNVSGAHAVLAVGYDGDTILVDDPNITTRLCRLKTYDDGNWDYDGPGNYSSRTHTVLYSTDYYKPFEILQTGKRAAIADGVVSKTEILLEGMDRLSANHTLVAIDANEYTLSGGDRISLSNAINDADDFPDGEWGIDTSDMYWMLDANEVSVSNISGGGGVVDIGSDQLLISATVPDGASLAVSVDGVDSDVEIAADVGKEVFLSFDEGDDDGDYVVALSGVSSQNVVRVERVDEGYSVAGLKNVSAAITVDGQEGEDYAPVLFDGTAVVRVDVEDAEIEVVQDIPAESISISQQNIELEAAGDTFSLGVEVLPENASVKTVAWSSDNQSVATVSDSGLVAAVGEGTAVITAALPGSGLEARCVVTVSHVHVLGGSAIENVIDATCENAGSRDVVVRCSKCGEVLEAEREPIPALGHDWGEWDVRVEPTYDAPGVRERVCSRCGEAEQEAIAQLERAGGDESDGETGLSAVTVADDATGVTATSKAFAGDGAAILIVTDLSAANAARASEMKESYGTAGAAVFRAYDVKVERVDDAGNRVAVDSGLDDLILTFPVDVAYDGRAAKVVHLHDDGGNVVARTYALEVADGKLVVATGQLSEFAISVAGEDDGGASEGGSDGIGDGENSGTSEGGSGDGSQQGVESNLSTEAGAGKAADEAGAEVPGGARASGEDAQAGAGREVSHFERESADLANGPEAVRRASGGDGAVPPTGDPAAAAILIASSVALIASLVALRSRRNGRRTTG